MADPYQNVIPGAPKGNGLSARTVNGLLQSGAAHARNKLNAPGFPQNNDPLVPACECLIQNLIGANLPQGSIVVASAAVVNPAVHPLAAQDTPTFTAAAVADITLPFVILSEPIPMNAIGEAVASGLAVCTVIISDATHTRAVPVVGVKTHLISAASGGVPLWWKPSGTGSKTCLVMVGSEGGGGPDATPTVRGWVSTGTQSFGGDKTFQNGTVTVFESDPASAGPTTIGPLYFKSTNLNGTLQATITGTQASPGVPPGITFQGGGFSFNSFSYGDFNIQCDDLNIGNSVGTLIPTLSQSVVVDGVTLTFTKGLLTGVA